MNNRPMAAVRAAATALLIIGFGSPLAVATAATDGSAPAVTYAPGTRVWIETSGSAPTGVIGTINATDDHAVHLDVAGHAEPVAIARDQITRFRVSAGRSSRLVHALVGAVIGAIGGAVVASHSGGQQYPGTTAAAMTAVALAGAGVGAALPAGERWSDLPVARYRVALVSNPGAGFRFAFSRGF